MRRAVGRWWLGVEIWERIRSAGLSDVGYGGVFFGADRPVVLRLSAVGKMWVEGED